MTTETSGHSKTKRVGLTILALAGLVTAYFLFYFLLFKPSLPKLDPLGERYMSLVKQGNWKAVAAMHASPRAGEAAVERWKRIRRAFGPIRSYKYDGQMEVTFPLRTRGMMGYVVHTDKGDLFTLLDLKARFGSWKIRETRAEFQPPQPFQNPTDGPRS